MSVIDWLLEDDAPPVAYLARARLLGENAESRRMRSLRRRANDYRPIAAMLERIDEAIDAPRYAKYRGAYWTLHMLAEIQADGRDRRIQRLVNHVLEAQLANDGFSPNGQPRIEIACLNANVLRAAVYFGRGEDERVQAGYRRLMERIVPHGGIPCIVLQCCLHTSCKMAIPQTLRCLAAAPPGVSVTMLRRARKLLVDQVKATRVYQYVRPDAREYQHAVKARPRGMKEVQVRQRWLESHQVSDDQLVAKPGWLRFGFPNSYNPDLLEAMLALCDLRVRRSPAFDAALDVIGQRRQDDGTWKLQRSLNGKMLADVERKGKPSKWVTLRALLVLRHFGRVKTGQW